LEVLRAPFDQRLVTTATRVPIAYESADRDAIDNQMTPESVEFSTD